MLDLRWLLDHPELVEKSLEARGVKVNLEEIIELGQVRRDLRWQVDEMKSERNKKSKQIGLFMREGKKDEAEALKAEVGQLPGQIKDLTAGLNQIEEDLREKMLWIPNIPHESTPLGADEDANEEVRIWGEVPQFDFEIKDHVAMGEDLGLLDFERAAKITGARFTLYKGLGARLERALINFFLDENTTVHGYTEVMPPFMANRDSCIGSGNLPKFEEDLFKVTPLNYYMIPTAEVPLTNIYRDDVLKESELPVRFCAYTPCFRSEAGSYGRDVRGLIRQHQFHKVELYSFCHPDDSYNEHERLTGHAENLLQKLGLPYRVIVLCTGDMGFSAAKTYDLEVWIPSQDTYREISSCSNCGDFQARRSNIRFKPSEKKKGTEFVNTLNGSGLAVGRALVAILENYQQPDGSLKIPEVLQDFMGTDIIKP